MKRNIIALTAAVGLAIATSAMAYPNQGRTTGTADNTGTATANGTMNSQSQDNNRQMEKVKLEELPQPVQATINQHTQGGEVKHIARMSEGSQTFYLVTLKASDGNTQHFRVDSTGKYLGTWKGEQNANQNNVNTQPQGNIRGQQIER